MQKLSQFCITAFFLLMSVNTYSQEKTVLRLTIKEAIEMARKKSPEIVRARHSFHSSYWNYCYFKANYLPSLTFSSSPNFSHSISVVELQDGPRFIQHNRLITDATLSLNQNIALTGGTLSLQSNITRLDLFGDTKQFSYQTNPVSLVYRQNILGHNYLKWDKKIDPLHFERAKKDYIVALENVSQSAIYRFFSLASAQRSLDIAKTNYASADTLYNFGKGRYKIGRITDAEMLQLEVKILTEETNKLNAEANVEDWIQSLRAYLGITDDVIIVAVVERDIPNIRIDAEKALQLALENNPKMIDWEIQKLGSESNVSYAKGISGLGLDLYAQFGLSQTGENISAAYKSPLDQQSVRLGISVPILDWGRGKGRVKVAESNRKVVENEVEQARMNFEMNLIKAVRQFNLQMNRITVADKTEDRATRRSDIAYKLYMLERSTILELNDAITESASAQLTYIYTLRDFWSQYYELRGSTLFDFEKNIPLTEDYNSLLK